METNQNRDLGDKKWNNSQQKDNEQQRNEGFSGENLPDDYNPSKNLKSESETDASGAHNAVKRARPNAGNGSDPVNDSVDNSKIKNKKSVENRDHNYDPDASRQKGSHPEDYKNRGNMTLDEQ